ncbi:MAG: tagaturonate epimerase family protein [Planctomycetota bacterium]|nr:tagaturonate epimerase family protein [Planctomycetota bacterium]
MAEQPQVLGLKRSFGFGDRLGLATPGHLDAVKGSGFAPIFAQQSIREMRRTKREPVEVMRAAVEALKAERWADAWGADADHLQTEEDVQRTAREGFTFFTIDPSAHVHKTADELNDLELETAYQKLAATGAVQANQAFDLYLGKSFDLGEGARIDFEDRRALTRAVVKYGAALAHTKLMNGWIAKACAGRPFELEMSVDETPSPTSPLEHLFVGLELKRLGVKLVSLAPRFTGEFEKGIDYKGDLQVFEADYKRHVAIAKHCGPYKLSVHSGSDKFRIYPIVGRLSGELVHVKTAGTSYLEALRVAARADKPLFREIVGFCRGRYETDRATYHVSAKLGDVPAEPADAELERAYLEHDSGRQILHVTFGSVLGGESGTPPYKQRLLELLHKRADLYREVLRAHLGKHIKGLLAG